MAARKFIELVAGKLQRRQAKDSSAGAGDAGEIVALNSAGLIDLTMLPNTDVKTMEASEALTAGDYVNIWNDGGTQKMRKADNSNGRAAHGYVLDAVLASATGNVFFEGSNSGLAGLTIGDRVYLGVAGGVIQPELDEDDVANNGKIHQLLGVAISPTEVNWDMDDCITL